MDDLRTSGVASMNITGARLLLFAELPFFGPSTVAAGMNQTTRLRRRNCDPRTLELIVSCARLIGWWTLLTTGLILMSVARSDRGEKRLSSAWREVRRSQVNCDIRVATPPARLLPRHGVPDTGVLLASPLHTDLRCDTDSCAFQLKS